MILGASILHIVDFNDDGKVDIADLKVFMTYCERENPPKPNAGK